MRTQYRFHLSSPVVTIEVTFCLYRVVLFAIRKKKSTSTAAFLTPKLLFIGLLFTDVKSTHPLTKSWWIIVCSQCSFYKGGFIMQRSWHQKFFSFAKKNIGTISCPIMTSISRTCMWTYVSMDLLQTKQRYFTNQLNCEERTCLLNAKAQSTPQIIIFLSESLKENLPWAGFEPTSPRY